jgi:hypothetical protein
MGTTYYLVGKDTWEALQVQNSSTWYEQMPAAEELRGPIVHAGFLTSSIYLPHWLLLRIYERFRAANPSGTEMCADDPYYYFAKPASIAKGIDEESEGVLDVIGMVLDELAERYAPELHDPKVVDGILADPSCNPYGAVRRTDSKI